MEIIHLIRQMSRDNMTWGAPKNASELALLGHKVADSTAPKCMVRVRVSDPSQRWRPFIRNHMDVTAACDFFVVPTATFELLYVFVVLSHARRLLLHDRDGIYGWEFKQMVKMLGIRQICIAIAPSSRRGMNSAPRKGTRLRLATNSSAAVRPVATGRRKVPSKKGR